MTLHVSLAERSYPIFITAGCLQDCKLFQPLIANRKVCVVSNETVAPLYLEQLEQGLGRKADTVVVLPDGERYKTLATVEKIFDAALSGKLNRSSLIIALGGGVVGDMAGFAAACYQRGIEFIQVPTTLLSQVDSSVGGKTGVNHPLGKNMIGAFHQPKAVFIDINTLETLPPREFAAGLAEVIKYGLIYDSEFFTWLELNMSALNARNTDALSYAIRRSCAIKAEIVAEDETESGIRAILNLGHTFGHAIEANMGYGEWLHGEAIAPGMMMAVDLSVRQGWLDAEVLQRTEALLLAANLPLRAPTQITLAQFLEAMSVDKKNISSAIRLVLLRNLGEAFVCDDYSLALMHQTIEDNR